MTHSIDKSSYFGGKFIIELFLESCKKMQLENLESDIYAHFFKKVASTIVSAENSPVAWYTINAMVPDERQIAVIMPMSTKVSRMFFTCRMPVNAICSTSFGRCFL